MDNTFTAGTVTLSEFAYGQVNFVNIAPGDAGIAGELEVSYTGNLGAWLGITASKAGDFFAGATPKNNTNAGGTGPISWN